MGYDENFNKRVARFASTGAFDEVFAADVLTGPSELAVDRSTDDVYVTQYSSAASEELLYQLSPAGTVIDTHIVGSSKGSGGSVSPTGVAIRAATGKIYLADGGSNRVLILGTVVPPDVAIDPVSNILAGGATLEGSVDPNGTSTVYRFEYSEDGTSWKPVAGDVSLGSGTTPAPVTQEIGSLEPDSQYYVRLAALPFLNPVVYSPVQTFTTVGVLPRVQTVGSPYRTATTARLDARVNPRGSTGTSYHFEWGLTAAYGQSAPAGPEASVAEGIRSVLVSQQIADLQPGTTYHYRVVATNAEGTSVGADQTVTTRASDAALSHGPLPGPPGSDRAWEQISKPDTNGNPAAGAMAISTDGTRAVYGIAGGTEGGGNGFGGLVLSPWFAERTASGWISKNLWPDRSAASGPYWEGPGATDDLSEIFTWNGAPASGPGAANDVFPSIWRLHADGRQVKLGSLPLNAFPSKALTNSEDGSVVLIASRESLDPDHPAPTLGEYENYLYDFGSGEPRLVSLLPGDTLPPCGIGRWNGIYSFPGASKEFRWLEDHWVSVDGSRVFFPAFASDCSQSPFNGTPQLFMRDLDREETVLISGPPDHGPDLGGALIAATPGGPADADPAAYIWTESSLVAEDSGTSTGEPGSSDDADVYRYDIGEQTHECLTCALGDVDIFAEASGAAQARLYTRVSEDGSKLYFATKATLIPGEGVLPSAEGSGLNLYRLDIASGDLAFVGVSASPGGAFSDAVMTEDGSVLVFSSMSTLLNPLTGSDNGGFLQQYRYDDRDGSLLCISCPPGGATHPTSAVIFSASPPFLSPLNSTLSADGRSFVFRSDDGLLPIDQNGENGEDSRRGADIYEWRDGRLLLVTDGLTAEGEPRLASITPDGKSIFFNTPVELTPESKDGYAKLYVARIGGGFKIEPPAPPCALEVCQGDPTPAPSETPIGSARFAGPGNEAPKSSRVPRKRCHKIRKRPGSRAKARCGKAKSKKTRSAHKNGGAR
jgi:hypothetical protein